ncbi:class I SAM-dependent methyltransferase [Pyruvatibacter mobilis]|uniref:class I SAM-dependent methyltransferase n=1 Tax=Pyruvatibacter mobilis TaxID=1712261 RepID=UPI003BAD75EB
MTAINEDQKTFWNGQGGETWVSGQEEMDRFLAPFSDELMVHAAPQAGEHVLDIGCGTGETSLRAAEAVGADGAVHGVDISVPMLELAKARAAAAGLTQARFSVGDAQSDALGDPVDLVISRFGVMFFENPVTAFGNIRAHVRPGGRMVFACWQPVRENEWVHVGLGIAKKHVEFPPPPDPYAPGPFAFADIERTLGLLTEAGWRNAKASPFAAKLNQGETARDGAEGLMLRGPISRALAEASEAQKAAVLHDLTEALEAKIIDGAVRLDAAIWIVSADA